jgi:hypothetical protein
MALGYINQPLILGMALMAFPMQMDQLKRKIRVDYSRIFN